MAKLNKKDIAADFEIRLGGAFEPVLNTDGDLEELYENVVPVTNKSTEDLV